jgi:hypothetical protein
MLASDEFIVAGDWTGRHRSRTGPPLGRGLNPSVNRLSRVRP